MTCKIAAQASKRTVYRVLPDSAGEQWVVSREGDDAFREQYRTKEEAVSAAKEWARGQEPSQVKVHLTDGSMEYESMYGFDPREYPS